MYSVYNYQAAAEQYCHRNNLNPYGSTVSGIVQWQLVAAEMAKLAEMIDLMRQYGNPV